MDSPRSVALLAEPVAILDIRDAEGFVQATINRWQSPTKDRGRIELSEWEREELAATGLEILCKLRDRFNPHMDGYEHAGRFSGFAAVYLPRKLGDAWHRMHDEHQLRTQPDGTRRWHYGEKAVSLEALTADDPDRHLIMASTRSGFDLGDRLHAALVERARGERDWVVQVAKLIGAGTSPAAAATELGLLEETVRRHMRSIVRAAPTADHQFAKTSELRAALDLQAERDAEIAARVGELLGEGATAADVADTLTIEVGDVRDHQEAIRRVWPKIESGHA